MLSKYKRSIISKLEKDIQHLELMIEKCNSLSMEQYMEFDNSNYRLGVWTGWITECKEVEDGVFEEWLTTKERQLDYLNEELTKKRAELNTILIRYGVISG